MTLNQLNILINDTFVAGTILNIERTENANPVLKYNGADDEYQPIMASELTFNMLVPDAADGKFLHLFTGNETRYQVQLENALTGAILWTGFLLPDFYSEPYENSSFFVSFTATDGLARLKNKYLSDDFYKDKKTLPQILTACLKLTGSFFNTAIAPAITSAVVALKQYEILVPTALYIKKDKKQNAYEILEDLLTVMGCRLFLWSEMWYIIGINRFNDLTVNVEFYGIDGTYFVSGANTITRTENTVTFEAIPTISVIPPFKDVIIDWKKETHDNVFPLDVVFQRNDKWQTASNLYDPALATKYWTQVGAGFYKVLYYNSVPLAQNITDTQGPFYLNIVTAIAEADVESKYITLETPVNILGSTNLDVTVDLEFEATIWCDADPAVKVEAGAYAKKLLYELTKDGVAFISNKASFDTYSLYDFEYTTGDVVTVDLVTYWAIKCSLKIEGVAIKTDGEINIKLHPVITVAGAPVSLRVSYDKLNITYKSNDLLEGYLKKSRAIDYTTSKEINTVWGFDKNDLTENKFLISPAVIMPETVIYTPPAQYAINKENFYTDVGYYPLAGGTVTTYVIGVNYKNYLFLIDHKNLLYIKNAATNTLLQVTYYYALEDSTSATGYVLYIIYFDNIVRMTAAEDLILDVPSETITVTDDRYLLGAWKRVGETENIDYNEALARIYHSTIGEVKFKIEGIALEVINPLELFQFNYFAPRNYNATSLTMNLSAGTTTVILIESVKAIIEDYE